MALLKMIIRRKTATGWDIIDPYAENFQENVEAILEENNVATNAPELDTGILTAMTLISQNTKELDKWRNQRIQQGTGIISNKFVIRGCVVSPITGTRNIKVTENETYADTGMSLAYIDGAIHSIPDKWNTVAAVPQNKTNAAVTYYAYLIKNDEGKYEVQLSDKREGVLALYRLVVRR